MNIRTKYAIGQIVYLITDMYQLERMVTTIKIEAGGTIIYNLSCGVEDTAHYECEVTDMKNIIKALGIHGN